MRLTFYKNAWISQLQIKSIKLSLHPSATQQYVLVRDSEVQMVSGNRKTPKNLKFPVDSPLNVSCIFNSVVFIYHYY